MRFCLDFGHQPWSRASDAIAATRHTLAVARLADVAGIDAIWVTEDPDGWDAFAVLGAIAALTQRTQLGTGVTNPYLRHPNTLAASIATLDRLSGGRAVLGLGRGQPEWYAQGLGMAVGSPLAVLEETIDLLHQWWVAPYRAAAVDSSRYFPVQGWERMIHPVQTRPPIYLAAAGARALALAGRVADGVMFNALTSDEFLAEAIPTVQRAATLAGRHSADLAFVLRTPVTVTDDVEPILERQKNLLALVGTLPGMDRLYESDGFDVPAIMATARRRMRTQEILAAGGGFPELRRRGDLRAARAAIPTGLIERLAIVGSLGQVQTRLQRLAVLGVTHVSVAPPPPDSSAEAFGALLGELRRSPLGGPESRRQKGAPPSPPGSAPGR